MSYTCKQGQRYNAFDNGMISEFAGLSKRKQKVMNMVRHARELEFGTIQDFTGNRETFSSWDKVHINRKLQVVDNTPFSGQISDTICRKNIFNSFSDVTLKEHYKGDKTALNKMMANR